jgi:hypothetical protein
MQTNTNRVAIATIGIGWLLAVLVLIADVVLLITGMIDLKLGLLIGGLAIARLVV